MFLDLCIVGCCFLLLGDVCVAGVGGFVDYRTDVFDLCVCCFLFLRCGDVLGLFGWVVWDVWIVVVWSTNGQQMVNTWSTYGQLMVNEWSTTCQQMVNEWSTTGQTYVQ